MKRNLSDRPIRVVFPSLHQYEEKIRNTAWICKYYMNSGKTLRMLAGKSKFYS
jgi:hypothetical protein